MGAIIAILMVRLLPARRLSEWMGAAAIVIGTLLSLLFYLPRMLGSGNDEISVETEAKIANALDLAFILLRPQDGGSALSDFSDIFVDEEVLSAIFSTGVLLSGLIYLITWLSFSRIASSALSIERGAVYILRSAPIRASRIMRAKVFGVLIPYMGMVSLRLVGGLFVFGYSVLWTPYAWLVLLFMGFGVISYAVSLDFIYPNLDWEDPRKMTNRKAGWPSLIGTLLYSLIVFVIAVAAFAFAVTDPLLAAPIVLFGLGLLAGGTWFFIGWRIRRVEAAWPSLGED